MPDSFLHASYRPAVAAVIQAPNGQILIGERSDRPGSWQFPQGGKLENEASEAALARELQEEVSIEPGDYTIISKCGPYRYLFPKNRTKEGYRGQEHIYFLVKLTASMDKPRVETENPEFRALKWIKPEEFSLSWLSEMKREPYKRVFQDLFKIVIS